MRQDALMDRPQVERGASDSVVQRRAVKTKLLALVDLSLAIERQMIGVFGNKHVGDRRLGRQAALDEARWGRRLKDDVFARAASVFWPAHDRTRNCAGTTSSRSLTSSPIRCSAPLQHGQVLSSTSTSVSMRGS
jgi:hypothetical protein